MQPLRDLVLIKQEDAVKEVKRPSGIVLLSTENNRYQIGDEEALLQDLIKKPKTNKGDIVSAGNDCKYFTEGDNVIYKRGNEVSLIDYNGDVCAFVKESDILVKYSGKSFLVHPDYVLIKITLEARLALFNKKIRRDDGTEVLLFIGGDKGKDDADANSIFVGSGEVVAVGSNVKNVEQGDLGLISYLCDNDESIIVGYYGQDKIIAVKAITTRHKERLMSYASRRPVRDNKGKEVVVKGKLQTYSKDRIVFDKDDYDELASLYGVVRGNQLIAVEPYCFLEHEETKVMKVGSGGIIFEEDEKIISRKLLAVSQETKDRIDIKEGQQVILDDFDVFQIEFDGKKISAINDIDILYR